MDLDLFSAFDGGETVAELPEVVNEAKVESPKAPAGKRKATAPAGAGDGEDGGDVMEDSVLATAKKAKTAEPVALVQGEETETIREDGTRVKSYSVVPADWVAPPYEAPPRPAKTYPFTLDPFQAQAISYIERNESVLVSAHTSAGKTVTAEYAIAKSLRDKQRVIYTSPIKALSNQKYRDLQEEFGDVGLMTGDITINPTATVLIMTTEILRSMLYRGSEVMREVAWVIYDEIHYMRDKSRGVVWEESIILLPHKVRFVFLSATIPNSREFVAWVAKQHHQPCHVVYTDYRPVPLQHYLFPAGGEGLHLVVDEKGRFLEQNFQAAMATLQPTDEQTLMAQGKKLTGAKKQMQTGGLKKIVALIMKRQLDPAIIFSFSKKECEANALQMKGLTFNDQTEGDLVQEVYRNAMEALSEEDKTLPQVEALLPLLCRGIGIHHGGLLPILKEVIEILFQEGLIKCLFATETFSIGLNMPARTVVFTSTRKFDGADFRWVTSGEYIQMSGRAGRRGKDVDGKVIQMLDEKMDPDVAKAMLYGDADPLHSSYHINYNMLLNMLRVEGADPEFIVRSSFHQFQQEQGVPALEEEAELLTAKANAIEIKGEDDVVRYHTTLTQLEKVQEEILTTIQRPEYCMAFLQVGRLVYMREPPAPSASNPFTLEVRDWGWGVVINVQKVQRAVARAPQDKTKPQSFQDRAAAAAAASATESVYTLEVLVRAEAAGGGAAGGAPRPVKPGSSGKVGEMTVVPFELASLAKLSSIRVHLPSDIRAAASRSAVGKSLAEIGRRHPNGLPELDPIDDIGIKGSAFEKLVGRGDDLEERLEELPLHKAPDKQERYALYKEKADLLARAKLLKAEAKSATHVVMHDQLRRMKRVLRRLGHCDAAGIIQLKGRVACEINACDELVVTELIFNGTFNELTMEQTAAVLSCLVHQEKGKEDGASKLNEQFKGLFRQVQDAARQVGKIAEECKVEIEVEDYVNSFTPDVMEVCHDWCAGAKFVDVMKKTELYEGSVIRIIRRLEELLRQLSCAANAIGNVELKKKFEAAANKMRRDIVFCGSLYL